MCIRDRSYRRRSTPAAAVNRGGSAAIRRTPRNGRDVELETISTEEAGKRWQQDRLGDLEPIFVLFKNMPMAYKAYKAGFRYTTLQVGGIGGGVGRKNIVGPISFDDNDAKMLDEMFQDGLEAYFQPVPDNQKVSWIDVKAKHYPNL